MSLRVLIAVTHLLGAGHLTRAVAIARALAATGQRVTLVTGGRPTPLIATAGLDVVQLPPVQAYAEDFSTLRDAEGREARPDLMRERTAQLLVALDRTVPDIVITELFPFGRRSLAPEFLALVEAAAGRRPRPLLLCSIRDILVAPSKPAKIDRSHTILAGYFDAVLVHGDPELVPLDASWPVNPALRSRLIYTGYVDASPAEPVEATPSPRSAITVSGGSSSAGLLLYRAAIEAAERVRDRPWRILVGHGIEAEPAAELKASAGENVVIERARADFRQILVDSAVFVGQAGYNTVVDLLATRTRAVLVPFERGQETEQRLRAEHLRAKGVASLLPEAELSGPKLADYVLDALDSAPPPALPASFDGAARTAEIIGRLAAKSGARLEGPL